MCIRGYRWKGYVSDVSRLSNEVTGFTGKAALPARVGQEKFQVTLSGLPTVQLMNFTHSSVWKAAARDNSCSERHALHKDMPG